MKLRHALICGCLMVCGICARCPAWAHQGHILLTRLAALRIIDDPTAPQGLRDFLKQNMPHSMEDCRELAELDYVGPDPLSRNPDYGVGLDNWATMPDRVKTSLQGMVKIEPYGMSETWMHRMDLEVFSKQRFYSDDLAGKPDVDQIPHDLSDPRWKRAGFVPWRVEEMYHKFAKDIGPGQTVADPDDALKAAGYLAHYIEDSTQPHHATGDYQSQSYLAGRIKNIPASTQPQTLALAMLHLPAGINPHGDIEYQLFENTDPPRDKFRQEFWKLLLMDIDTLAAERAQAAQPSADRFDPFRWDLHILGDSYDYLPFVGRAVQAGYATGKFDPAAFFGFTGQTHGQTMTVVQLIALQNAKAVFDVELAYRLAWDEAHKAQTQP
jgi:hypothetical protein